MHTSKGFYGLLIVVVFSLTLMAGCGGGGSPTSDNNTGGSTYSISGKVADSSNIGISGVTVGLTGANTSSATTDSSGNFNFTGLANGSYTVTPSMTGYTFNPSSKSVTVSGADVTGQNFVGSGSSGADAYEPNDSFAAASTALNSGNAVTAQISSATDVDYYAINVTSAGIVSITMVPPTNIDYNLELCNAAYYGIASSYTGTGATETISYSAIPGTYYIKVYGNYSAFDTANSYSLTATWPASGGSTYSISGSVADSSNLAMSSVTVTLSGANTGSTTTNSSGNYTFSGLANGSYTVSPSKTGYVFNPSSITLTVSGADVTGQNFMESGSSGTDAYEPNDSFTAASTVLNSGNAVTPKISSATDLDYYAINVTSSGTISITMTPPINSDYDLELYNSAYSGVASSYAGTGTIETISYSVTPGTYYIKVYGYNSVFDTVNSYSLTATWSSSGGSTYSISGTVANSSNVAMSGVMVTLSGASTGSTTNSSGNFTFSGLANGTYTVTPSQTGYSFNPSSKTVTVSGGNVTGQDFIGSTVSVTIASGMTWARDIVVDTTSVYWTDYGSSGAVYKVPANGGTVTTLATSVYWPTDIAVDSTSVYWAAQDGTVKKVSINGGTVTTLASGMSTIWGMTADANNIYWTETGYVKKVSKNGGAVTTLASGVGDAQEIAVYSTNIYWIGNGGGMGLGTVKKVSINGGTVTTLVASGLNQPAGIAVDSTNVYWTEFGGAVQKVSKNGGTVTMLASGQSSSSGIAVDSTSVYWKDDAPMAVKKVGINGGTVTTLATSSTYGQPAGIALDSTNVYWTEPNAVKKISK